MGTIVIGQTPNLPIIVFTVAFVISKIAEGSIQTLFETLSFGALFVFAWLELFDGVNYFRRAIGLLVCIYLLTNGIR